MWLLKHIKIYLIIYLKNQFFHYLPHCRLVWLFPNFQSSDKY